MVDSSLPKSGFFVGKRLWMCQGMRPGNEHVIAALELLSPAIGADVVLTAPPAFG